MVNQESENFFDSLTDNERSVLIDALVLDGSIDWLDWDMATPSPEFKRDFYKRLEDWERSQ
ncbi:MAG TPA: hypothetical protein PLE74_07620 [Candidatus Cloacimonadota bacterium]|nr:hypothetical protein [Candidatus Cloacimonadota bacterium]